MLLLANLNYFSEGIFVPFLNFNIRQIDIFLAALFYKGLSATKYSDNFWGTFKLFFFQALGSLHYPLLYVIPGIWIAI